MPITPEGRVKRDIKALLVTSGAYYFMPVQTGMGMDTVDFLGFRSPDGRGFAIEAKAPGEKPTARQRARLRTIYEMGAAAFVLDGDLADMRLFQEWLATPGMRQGSKPEAMILKWNIWKDEEVIA